ncbi:hypothetical protein EDD85DRAFT_389632 [Armillaria nabsnona]|nr:hypothetical protein EDD85DRAFT_389632 [Armillaria nabsnona]
MNGIPRVRTGALVGGTGAFCSGIPHHGVTDDLCNGFYIPGGATVIITDTWAVLRDDKDYRNPTTFVKEDKKLQ